MEYYVVSSEALKKILDCFCNNEEFNTFNARLEYLVNELAFSNEIIARTESFMQIPDFNSDALTIATKNLFLLAMFFKDNIELMHEMIKVIEYRKCTENEVEKLKKEEDSKE